MSPLKIKNYPRAQINMHQIKAKILYNKRQKGNYYEMSLYALAIAKEALAGQFINIKVNDGVVPLLRRPFSIHKSIGREIIILYEVKGQGSEGLSKKNKGEYLDVIGPLGNGFDLGQVISGRYPVLIAGGMGVAPLLFLAQKIKEARRKISTQVFLGAKQKGQLLCEQEFVRLGCELKIATDDGSKGFKGRVTELFVKSLKGKDAWQKIMLYCCGPHRMLKETARIAFQHNIPAQVSIEEHMACGIGACMGCAVRTKQGYSRACKEGPVFEAEQIIW